MKRYSFEAWISILANLATALALIVGVGLFNVETRIETNKRKTQESLNRITEFSYGRTGSAREKLSQFWREYEVVLFAMRTDKLQDSEYERFMREMVDQEPLFTQEVLAVVRFFDEIRICVDTSICDAALVQEYFCSHVERYSNLYEPIISSLRNRLLSPEIGSGLRQLSDDCSS